MVPRQPLSVARTSFRTAGTATADGSENLAGRMVDAPDGSPTPSATPLTSSTASPSGTWHRRANKQQGDLPKGIQAGYGCWCGTQGGGKGSAL